MLPTIALALPCPAPLAPQSIAPPSARFVIDSEDTAAFLGSAICGLGDLDGDGRDEVALGAFGRGAARGRVLVHRSRPDAPLLCLDGQRAGELLGLALACAGDLDGDGVADLLVGAPGAEPRGPASGLVRVVSGRDGTLLAEIPGDAAGDELGAAVAGAGDVDRDGTPDFVVGAPGVARKGYAVGRAAIYSGRTREILRLWGGESGEDRFGGGVAGLGDVDGDGHGDVAIAALQVLSPRPGYVRVYSGIDGLLIGRYGGREPGDAFGSALASLGDVDGVPGGELAIGAYLASGGAPGAGAVTVISIADGGVRYRLESEVAGAQFGAALAALDDLDGDGARELAIGAPHAGRGAGLVRVVSGRSGATLLELAGERPFERFGAALAGLSSGSGPALAIGAPDHGSRRALGGRVYLLDLAQRTR